MKVLLGVIVMIVLGGALLHRVNSSSSPLESRIEGTLRLATYNVHYIVLNEATGAWSVGDWKRRRGLLDTAFKALNADVIGFQEMESFAGGDNGSVNLTLDWLLERNSGYAAAAVGDWRTFPSTQPIFYRKGQLEVLDQGWFFFSETPDVIYSRTFNGSYPAFASWAQFRDRNSQQSFFVFNVHLEFKSRSNRTRSTELIARQIGPLLESGEKVFLVGDLNALKGFDAARILEDSGLSLRSIPGSTYHLNAGVNLFGAIDHIAHSAGIEPSGRAVVLQQRFNGEWPTDHYPVIADYRLQSREVSR